MLSRSPSARGVVLAAVALAATAATGLTAATPTAGAQSCNSSPTYAGGGWLAFRPQGLGPVTAQTSVTYAPDRIFATDGTNLSRTDDGGCVWTTLPLPATPLVDASPLPVPLPVAVPPGTPTINAISAPSTATSERFVYLGADLTVPQTVLSGLPSQAAGTQAPATQPYVYASTNSGVSFQGYHSGLPTLGTVTDIAAAPSSPNIVYADVVDSTGNQTGLYRSTDFGKSWKLMSSAQPKQGTLKVNPVVGTSVFGEFAGGLEVSFDSGSTFTPVSDTRPTSSYDVAAGGGYIQLVQGFSDSFLWERSTNGGNTFVTHPSPVKVTNIATSALSNTVLLGSATTDWLGVSVGSTYVPLPVTPSAGPLSDVSMGAPVGVTMSASGIIIANQTGDRLVARLLVNILGTPKVDNVLTPVQLLHHIGVREFPSTLFPGRQTVTLAPGAHKDVTYQLLMPRTPSPVDLMYLVDTTSSTDLTLNAVRQDLGTVVNDLGATGLDAAFGVAEFRDYPPDDFGNGESTDYPYKLRRAIGPPDASLRKALNQLQPSGGGDLDEAALTALYQSTTGAGQTLVNVDNKRRQVIAPGLSAQYRPGSLRLAIVASDAGYHKESDYPTPSWAKTVAALRADGVHQVGLAVQTMSGGQPTGFDSLHDMQAMALVTGALAPIGGIDCDGDGQIDVPQGDPLVCKVPHPAQQKNPADGTPLPSPQSPPIHLADALVALTANLPDLAGVGLRITGAPATVASVVSVPSAPIVNVRADNTLRYTVRYTCPVSTTAHRWSLSLEAVAGLRPLTSSATDLACGARPKPAPIPPPAEILPGIAAVAAAPAVPPNPPAQGTGNANPNPAVNANAGFAQQEDQQRQLAFADADQGFELYGVEDETAQMSRRPSRDDTGFIAGAAGLMMGGFAVSYARRRKNRPEYARAYR
ncbi:MAG: hypothetical protein QOD07_24 [Frankiaceae bacterium]|nr:hypothetical protein [Frankiaceae bacterium]